MFHPVTDASVAATKPGDHPAGGTPALEPPIYIAWQTGTNAAPVATAVRATRGEWRGIAQCPVTLD
jgi:hypothetical protein